MQEILYQNETIQIKKERNQSSLYKIEFNRPNPLFINSLIKTKLILGTTVSDDYKLLRFKANTVTRLKKETKLSISQAANLLQNLVVQLAYLNLNNLTIIGYHPENIIQINGAQFIYLYDTQMVKEIDENDEIQITSPFSETDFFLSPELENIINIPSNVHYKTAYFSLALLIVNLLTNSNNNESINQENPIQLLDNHPIKNTKLYWLLSRCLNKDPLKRCLLFI
jgi:hypothetical protein